MSAVPVATIEMLRQKAKPEEPAEEERLKVIPIGEMSFNPPPPVDWIVEGLFAKKSLNAIIGDAGCGKTYAVIDMAARAVMGRDWLGHATRQTPVLIVDEESGAPRLQRRIRQAFDGQLVRREDNPQIYAICFAGFDARNEEDINALHIAIMQTGAELVIFDALMEITPGADENNVKDMLPALHNLRRVAEVTDAAFVIIHHSGKNGNYRGTSAIKGKLDVLLMLEKSKNLITFTTEKNRDGEPRQFTAEAHWIAEPPQFYLSETDLSPRDRDITPGERSVLIYLADNADAPIAEITKATDASKTLVKRLEATGHLEATKIGGKGRSNAALYGITQKGHNALKGDE